MSDNINADVDDGLDNDFNVDDVIKQPQNDNNPNITLNLVTKPNIEETEETKLFTGSVPGELPNVEAALTIITDNRAKVFDIKDVEEVIRGKETVSQEDAKHIDRVTGNFLGNFLTLLEFSEKPSKTNLQRTLSYLSKRISKEEIEHTDIINKFCEDELKTKYLHDSVELFKQLSDDYIPRLKDQLLYFDVNYDNVIESFVNNGDTIFQTKEGFINISKVPLTLLENQEIVPGDNVKDKVKMTNFINSIKSLAAMVKEREFVSLIYCICNGTKIQPPSQMDFEEVNKFSNELTLSCLLEFYKERHKIATVLETLLGEISNSINYIESTISDITGDKKESFTELDEVFANSSKVILGHMSFMSFGQLLIKEFLIINQLMSRIFPILKERV